MEILDSLSSWENLLKISEDLSSSSKRFRKVSISNEWSVLWGEVSFDRWLLSPSSQMSSIMSFKESHFWPIPSSVDRVLPFWIGEFDSLREVSEWYLRWVEGELELNVAKVEGWLMIWNRRVLFCSTGFSIEPLCSWLKDATKKKSWASKKEEKTVPYSPFNFFVSFFFGLLLGGNGRERFSKFCLNEWWRITGNAVGWMSQGCLLVLFCSFFFLEAQITHLSNSGSAKLTQFRI